MGAFSSFANRLPDPAFGIDEAGQNVNSAANYGPGFASVTFTKEQPTMMSRTNSERVVTRSLVGEKLKIAITYNPLTRIHLSTNRYHPNRDTTLSILYLNYAFLNINNIYLFSIFKSFFSMLIIILPIFKSPIESMTTHSKSISLILKSNRVASNFSLTKELKE